MPLTTLHPLYFLLQAFQTSQTSQKVSTFPARIFLSEKRIFLTQIFHVYVNITYERDNGPLHRKLLRRGTLEIQFPLLFELTAHAPQATANLLNGAGFRSTPVSIVSLAYKRLQGCRSGRSPADTEQNARRFFKQSINSQAIKRAAFSLNQFNCGARWLLFFKLISDLVSFKLI